MAHNKADKESVQSADIDDLLALHQHVAVIRFRRKRSTTTLYAENSWPGSECSAVYSVCITVHGKGLDLLGALMRCLHGICLLGLPAYGPSGRIVGDALYCPRLGFRGVRAAWFPAIYKHNMLVCMSRSQYKIWLYRERAVACGSK